MNACDGGDYFANHRRVRQFPWTLYHAPLERSLVDFLDDVSRDNRTAEVLVIGCGLMQELDAAAPDLRFTVVDIDKRAVDAVLGKGDKRIVDGRIVDADKPLSLPGRSFDAIYAKEVIEHIVDWPEYLRELKNLLAPQGRLWLSTPNYGEPWLNLLERTVLEWVARRDGFTRKHLHPSRFSQGSLQRALHSAGFLEAEVNVISCRLALCARARR